MQLQCMFHNPNYHNIYALQPISYSPILSEYNIPVLAEYVLEPYSITV